MYNTPVSADPHIDYVPLTKSLPHIQITCQTTKDISEECVSAISWA